MSSAGSRRPSAKAAEPCELALAFCFDIVCGTGPMSFAYAASLLRPWGWTRPLLLARLTSLSDEGLLNIDFDNGAPRLLTATAAGRHLSDGPGLCPRQRPRDAHDRTDPGGR